MEQQLHTPHTQRINKKAITIAGLLFVAIIAGMFYFAYLQKNEQQTVIEEDTQEDTLDQYADITRINGTHYFIDGVHTVVGEIILPTPCDLLSADATVAESYPEQVTLNFEVINNAETCIQVLTPARFMVSATASEAAVFSALFMGRPIELNLTPAPEGELPQDFEVFIKG